VSPKESKKRPVTSRSSTVIAAVVLVLVAVVVIGGVIYQSSRSKPRNEGYGSAQNSTVQVADRIVRVGAANAPVTVDVYEDFLCPICSEFEKRYGQELAQSLDQGKVAVRYHMLNFLNARSASKDYSTRAAAAALCVASDGNGAAFPKFHATLFTTGTQPTESSSTDLSDAQLADLAKTAGASSAGQTCITTGAKKADATVAAQAGEQELLNTVGQVGTPTVLKDGKQVNVQNSDWIAQLN
jgi:protein-disulfide isomerase